MGRLKCRQDLKVPFLLDKDGRIYEAIIIYMLTMLS